MDIKVLSENGINIVSVIGSIDSNTSSDFQGKVMGATETSDKIILDFSAVSFVSSAGLRVLLMVYRQIKSKAGKVVLAGISEEIREVMSMTGFINFFEAAPTKEDAMKLM